MKVSGFYAGKAKNVQEMVIISDHTFDELVDHGFTFTNRGATAPVTLTLPPAKPGMKVKGYVGAACDFRMKPAACDYVALPSSGAYGAADKYISADAVGESVELYCEETGKWSVRNYIGTWTKES